jgi:hypothetical protein
VKQVSRETVGGGNGMKATLSQGPFWIRTNTRSRNPLRVASAAVYGPPNNHSVRYKVQCSRKRARY